MREIFHVEVKNCDLSEEACNRAKEIFSIASDPVDIHNLPYEDEQVDVVVCSQTLEHVKHFHKAVQELLRVSRKAVVVTVPNEPKHVVEANIRKQIPHGHIHKFTLKSFDFLKRKRYRIISKKMGSPLLKIPRLLVEAMPREYHAGGIRKF